MKRTSGNLNWIMPVRQMVAACLCLLIAKGCAQKDNSPPEAPPPPTFSGPTFLHGTVGSMATITNYDPLLVSGMGLVVNLEDTGSSDVPPLIRRRLINEMARKGLGSARLGTRDLSPARVMDSPRTAVVTVEGIIPPGAVRGTRFDLLVTALPQTQTTSLEFGDLWSTDLAIGGWDITQFSRPFAVGVGPMYISPLETLSPEERRYETRRAVVLSGGSVTQERKLELILNQASWTRSHMIAERINQEFKRGPGDRNHTAVAKTDLLIEINVPRRFGSSPDRFLSLVQHLYVQRGSNFETEQAQRLADVLIADPKYADRVGLAWQALGRTIVPVLRRYYDHPTREVRLTALEAGGRMGDATTARPLLALSSDPDATTRRRVATMLGFLPTNLTALGGLRGLLNDADPEVRIAAYEAVVAAEEPALVNRVPFMRERRLDFILDLVEAQRPTLYASQSSVPRLAVFNAHTGFVTPMIANLWDSRLMIKVTSDTEPMQVYYREPDEMEGRQFEVAPTVANLIFLLGHAPTPEHPTKGLGLPYGRVVSVLHELNQTGKLRAPLILQESELANRVAEQRRIQRVPDRPEVGPMLPEEVDGEVLMPAAMGRPEIGQSMENAPIGRPEVGALPAP